MFNVAVTRYLGRRQQQHDIIHIDTTVGLVPGDDVIEANDMTIGSLV